MAQWDSDVKSLPPDVHLPVGIPMLADSTALLAEDASLKGKDAFRTRFAKSTGSFRTMAPASHNRSLNKCSLDWKRDDFISFYF